MSAETQHRKVDDRIDADGLERLQFRGGPGDRLFLEKVRAIVVGVFRVHEEYMLVHEHPSQRAAIDRPAYRLDFRHLRLNRRRLGRTVDWLH